MTIEQSAERLGAAPAAERPRHPRPALIAEKVSGAMSVARDGVTILVRRMPGTVHATRTAAFETTSALQTLSDPTLRSLAATSLGLGAGFYVAGAGRLAVVAGLAPAIVLGAAVLLRPIHRPAAEEANG
jgi:hypothetical protein